MINASKGLEKPLWMGQDYCLINYEKAVEVTYNKGRWFVNMPVETEISEPKNGGKTIALDPGLRYVVMFRESWAGLRLLNALTVVMKYPVTLTAL
jgi:transposase